MVVRQPGNEITLSLWFCLLARSQASTRQVSSSFSLSAKKFDVDATSLTQLILGQVIQA